MAGDTFTVSQRAMTETEKVVCKLLCPPDYPFWGNYITQARRVIAVLA